LQVPEVDDLRPTTGRLKQVLFDLLSDDVDDAEVLDLYGGSGQLGIEALSRGARAATFVETDPRARKAIRANLDACGFEGTIVAQPVETYLATARACDLALVDPPYARGLGSLVAALEALAGSIPVGATVAIEAPPGLVLPAGYLERRRRTAGSTELIVATLR
jgi:16S rRNA (guanine966-N2)-methyltransferase